MELLAPGLMLNEYVPRLRCILVEVEELAEFSDRNGRLLLVNPETWDLLPADAKKRIIDGLVRSSVDAGQDAIERYLASVS